MTLVIFYSRLVRNQSTYVSNVFLSSHNLRNIYVYELCIHHFRVLLCDVCINV